MWSWRCRDLDRRQAVKPKWIIWPTPSAVAMRSDVALDFAIFQLTPTRTRYSLSPACNNIHPFTLPFAVRILMLSSFFVRKCGWWWCSANVHGAPGFCVSRPSLNILTWTTLPFSIRNVRNLALGCSVMYSSGLCKFYMSSFKAYRSLCIARTSSNFWTARRCRRLNIFQSTNLQVVAKLSDFWEPLYSYSFCAVCKLVVGPPGCQCCNELVISALMCRQLSSLYFVLQVPSALHRNSLRRLSTPLKGQI